MDDSLPSPERLARAVAAVRAGGSATVESYAEGARITVRFDAALGRFERCDQDMTGGETTWLISDAAAEAFLAGCPVWALPG